MKYPIIFFTLFFAKIAWAEPLAAIVTFASTVVTAEGITKQMQFQDLLVRDQNSVWSQRIVPGAAPQLEMHAHNDSEQHHHDLNFALAGRWIELDKNNQPRFRLVRTQDKTIIEPRINEYGTLGFDGNWEIAYYQVNRAALQNMTLLKKSAPKHALWYEKQDSQAFTRILWDEQHEIPLAIETGSQDAKVSNKISYRLVAAPAKLPWDTLSDYQTMAYEDLLD